jgi:hypothetical protein
MVIGLLVVKSACVAPVDSGRLEDTAVVPRVYALSSHDCETGHQSSLHLLGPHSFVVCMGEEVRLSNCSRSMSLIVSRRGSISSSL